MTVPHPRAAWHQEIVDATTADADQAPDASTGAYVPTSLSGGLNPGQPGQPLDADASAVLAHGHDEIRAEVQHRDGTLDIVHGTSGGYEQHDRDRRFESQRAVRADRDAGRLAPEGFGGDPIGRALIAE